DSAGFDLHVVATDRAVAAPAKGGRWDAGIAEGKGVGLHYRTPLPSSPTRGEVPFGACGTILPGKPDHTLPLVGRVGEGVWRHFRRSVATLSSPGGWRSRASGGGRARRPARSGRRWRRRSRSAAAALRTAAGC